MGGAKKRSLAQAEKQQKRRGVSKQQKGHKARPSNVENQIKGSRIEQEIAEKDLKALASIKALTPFSVANKFNVKLSTANFILNMLERRNLVQKVASGGGRQVYKFIRATTPAS